MFLKLDWPFIFYKVSGKGRKREKTNGLFHGIFCYYKSTFMYCLKRLCVPPPRSMHLLKGLLILSVGILGAEFRVVPSNSIIR